jgi:hypothetical protein
VNRRPLFAKSARWRDDVLVPNLALEPGSVVQRSRDKPLCSYGKRSRFCRFGGHAAWVAKD